MARWLVAVLLVPALAACGGGGGGGGDSGSAGATQAGQNGQNSGSGRPDDQRTKDEGNEGGFRNAGEPSANVQGGDNTALISLSFPSKTSFPATISKVADCGSSAYATPASKQVQVTDGTTDQVEFQLPQWKPGTTSRTVCLTVTADDSTKRIEAVGSVDVISPDNGSTPGSGSTSGNGSTPGKGSTSGNGGTPGGGSSPNGGASTGAGSNP
ncbi:hypothetical protein ACIRRH_11550 [Kitasatospora sp. NPDC101235]|uniref:hypothetical protein n=1 Tax=Kitasatospora sp. NPDC101235 TaxID=3364101 RepID=UPI00381B8112